MCIASVRAVHAQSQPAGQVSRRIAAKAIQKATLVGMPTSNIEASQPPTSNTISVEVALADATAQAEDAAAYTATAKSLIDAAEKVRSEYLGAAAPYAEATADEANKATDALTRAKKAGNDHIAARKAEHDAIVAALSARQNLSKLQSVLAGQVAKKKLVCEVAGIDASGNTTYSFNHWLFPIWGNGCMRNNGAAALNYYQVPGHAMIGQQVEYSYNNKLSTNQASASLFTATFPGFQAVLSGTVTAPPATTGRATPAAAQATAQTNSVDSAISALQAGGDFNLSTPIPVFNQSKGPLTIQMQGLPNMGITINGLTTQSSTAQSTQYTFNGSGELYAELGSYDSVNGVKNAVFYVDLRGGREIISNAFMKSIGLRTSSFALAQFAAGIEFMNSIRIGFQYYLGPKGTYFTTDSAGTGTTPVTSSLGGFHLVVSYSRPKTATDVTVKPTT